jgi:prephenate dehydratase
MFYADLEADIESETLRPIREALYAKTDYLKILGSY